MGVTVSDADILRWQGRDEEEEKKRGRRSR
jgi:hypothetical protein